MAEWIRIVATTLKDYVKGEVINLMRNRKLLAMLKSRGRMKMKQTGRSFQWRVRYRRGNLQGFANGDTVSFPAVDRWKIAELPQRAYITAENMTKAERLMNSGKEQIIDLYAELARVMMEDALENFAEELYVDGNASGNSKRLHGIESFLATSGVTRAFVANPSDSYAGLNTALANYGGTWSNSALWPDGRGSPDFDFWAPILVNYTGPDVGGIGWEATTKTWPNTCMEALSYGIIETQRSKSKTGQLDTIILDRSLYRVFLERLREKQRIVVESNTSNSTLVKLGFTDVQQWDGVDVTWEYGITPSVGYGFNFDEIELRSWQPEIFVSQGPDFDMGSQSYRYAIDSYLNLRMNPRNFLKLAAYS